MKGLTGPTFAASLLANQFFAGARMRVVRSIAAFVLALAMPVVAAAGAPVSLAPLGPWNMHYGDNSCQLIRTFGDAANPTTFILERIAPRSNLSLLTYGDPLSGEAGDPDATAVFLPFTGNPIRNGRISKTLNTKKTALLWNSIKFRAMAEPEDKASRTRKPRDLVKEAADEQDEVTNAARITALSIRGPGARTVVLQTGSLGKAIAMMRQCANDQLTDWGIDRTVEDKIILPATAKRPLASVFSSSDYPRDAMMRGEQSQIQARLNIDATGKVTKCTSLTRFAAGGFAEIVCRRLSDVRWDPAELADGTKVPTYEIATIIFLMPL